MSDNPKRFFNGALPRGFEAFQIHNSPSQLWHVVEPLDIWEGQLRPSPFSIL